MREELLKILEMVKEGKLTPEEGEKLIAAIESSESGDKPKKRKTKKSILRIRINAKENGKKENAVVNVNIPLSVAKKLVGLTSLAPKDVKDDLMDQGVDLDGINLQELIAAFEDGEIDEELVNIVTSGENGEGATVKIYVD